MQTLVLVRHGATAWNDNGYCQGRKDVGLSDRGEAQVRHLRDRLPPAAYDRVYASPLARAQSTARILAGEPAILPELIEIDRGHWEGHPADEIRRRWGKLHKAWYDDPAGLTMPGGEAFDDLWERAGRLLEKIVAGGGERVLACGHKAINRVLIARALGRPSRGVWQIPQPLTACSVLVREGDAWEATRIGDDAHVPAELRFEE